MNRPLLLLFGTSFLVAGTVLDQAGVPVPEAQVFVVGTLYQVRVNAYYQTQTFVLRAELLP